VFADHYRVRCGPKLDVRQCRCCRRAQTSSFRGIMQASIEEGRGPCTRAIAPVLLPPYFTEREINRKRSKTDHKALGAGRLNVCGLNEHHSLAVKDGEIYLIESTRVPRATVPFGCQGDLVSMSVYASIAARNQWPVIKLVALPIACTLP